MLAQNTLVYKIFDLDTDFMNDFVDAAGWEAYVEYLHRYFSQHAGAKCLLWVNPAQGDPFEDNLHVRTVRFRVPVNHPRYDVSVGPYLVPLDLAVSIDADVLRESVRLAWQAWEFASLLAMQGQPICGWIAHGDARSLALHWAIRCHLHRRNGLAKLLRFHDPSVREWLWTTLSASQRSSLLGPAASVFSIGRAHALVHHLRDGGAIIPALDEMPSLTLTDAQWEQVEEYATVHAAWLAWHDGPTGRDMDLDLPAWEQTVLGALKQASNYGVVDAEDRQLFALHTLQFGANFHTSKSMLPVWTKTRSGSHYGNAIEQVMGIPVDQLTTRLISAFTIAHQEK
jgi:hypothetical protein